MISERTKALRAVNYSRAKNFVRETVSIEVKRSEEKLKTP